MRARRFAATLGAVFGLLISGSAIVAQDATPAGDAQAGPPLPAGCSVVASGLTNPRYVTVADDGTIYVSEAGVGGDEVLHAAAEPMASPEAGATPAAEAVIAHRGPTGQVTRIAPDGTQSVLASGLMSYDAGEGATGPAGIATMGAIHQGPGAMASTYPASAARPTNTPPVTHHSRLIPIRKKRLS